MRSNIPTAEQVQSELSTLGHAQIQRLSERSGVPFTTLWNVRSGATTNPGIETVRKFLPFIAEIAAEAAKV